MVAIACSHHASAARLALRAVPDVLSLGCIRHGNSKRPKGKKVCERGSGGQVVPRFVLSLDTRPEFECFRALSNTIGRSDESSPTPHPTPLLRVDHHSGDGAGAGPDQPPHVSEQQVEVRAGRGCSHTQ